MKEAGDTAEVCDRNIVPLGIPGARNALWRKDGLRYAPPVR